MIRLNKKQIIMLHEQLVRETGGEAGIRDEGMIESAINAPFQTFDSCEVYPSVQQKAARLGYGLAMDHGFVDGNKRIGAHAMLVFLALNGIELEYSQEELANEFLGVASGNVSFDELLEWVLRHQCQ